MVGTDVSRTVSVSGCELALAAECRLDMDMRIVLMEDCTGLAYMASSRKSIILWDWTQPDPNLEHHVMLHESHR